LLAADEETFRESTSRLLRREGFECQCVNDAEEAIETLRSGRFDVLISDIRMPRNPDLRVVREAREVYCHMPVILITGYPSADTAIRGIDMAVDAYLTKPLDMDELLAHVHKALARSRVRRQLADIVDNLHSVAKALDSEDLEPLLRSTAADDAPLAIIRNLASCLSELLAIWGKSAADHGMSHLCELLDCPQQSTHRQAILDAIEVLEKTKDNFKSKQLAELRTKLERSIGIK
jgi:DNA-binding response OmpR family regulator